MTDRLIIDGRNEQKPQSKTEKHYRGCEICEQKMRADERAKTLKEVKGKLYYMVDRQNAKCFFEWLEAELKKLAK